MELVYIAKEQAHNSLRDHAAHFDSVASPLKSNDDANLANSCGGAAFKLPSRYASIIQGFEDLISSIEDKVLKIKF